MPNKIYMPNKPRSGGGTTFRVSWDRIEDFLRGKDRYAGSNAFLNSDEVCDFVVTETGIDIYVLKASDVDSR